MIATLPPSSFFSRWSFLERLAGHAPSALNRFALVSFVLHVIFFIAFASMSHDTHKLPPPNLPVFIVPDETPVMQQVVPRMREAAPAPIQTAIAPRPSPPQPEAAPPAQLSQPAAPSEAAKPDPKPVQARAEEPVRGSRPAERDMRSEASLGRIQTAAPTAVDDARLSPEVARRGTNSPPSQGLSLADRPGRGHPESAGTEISGKIAPVPASRKSAEIESPGTAGTGSAGKRTEFTDTVRSAAGISGGTAKRALPSDAPVVGGSFQSTSTKRTDAGGDRLAPVGESRRPGLPAEAEPRFSAGKTPVDTGGPRTVEDVRGTWIRLENAGPVSHLNASCFGVPEKQLIYVDVFRLRCSANQIVEAWKKK